MTRPWWCALRRTAARDVPLFVASLPIFSRAYYAGRPFDETTLDVPLGCGPYKVGRFEAGRYIEYERVKDWWGADLPVSRGTNNFDVVATSSTATAMSPSKDSPARATCSARSSPRASGRRATTFRRSGTGASSAISFATTRRRARKAGSSTRGARSSRTSACVRRSSTPSISNGPTRPSCTGPMIGPIPCSRTPT